MKLLIPALVVCVALLVGCSRSHPLPKDQAEAALKFRVRSAQQTRYLRMYASPEVTRVIRELISQGKLKEVGALASFADAFPEPGRHAPPKPATANYNSYEQMWYVSCPVLTERYGQVIEVLNDPQSDTAQVNYTIVGEPVEPYYSSFKKYTSELPAAGPIRRQTAYFKRFQEGWRFVEAGDR